VIVERVGMPNMRSIPIHREDLSVELAGCMKTTGFSMSVKTTGSRSLSALTQYCCR
jgi:hypothetical protein